MTFPILSAGRVAHWLTASFVAIGLGLASQPAVAQQAPTTIRLSPDDEGRGQYGPQRNFYFLPPGKTGEDNYQSAGFFGGKLRPYLAGNAGALAELDHYKGHKTAYLIDKVVLFGSVALYGSQVFGHEGDAQYFNSTQQVAAGLAVASLLGTIFINRHTNEYLKQAVDNYNTSPHSTRWQRLRPAGMGVAATAGHPVLALRWQL